MHWLRSRVYAVKFGWRLLRTPRAQRSAVVAAEVARLRSEAALLRTEAARPRIEAVLRAEGLID